MFLKFSQYLPVCLEGVWTAVSFDGRSLLDRGVKLNAEYYWENVLKIVDYFSVEI